MSSCQKQPADNNLPSTTFLSKNVRQLLTELNAEYWRFIYRTKREPMCLLRDASLWDVYLKWHEYALETRDKEDFTGIEDVPAYMRKKTQQAPIISSEVDVFKNFEGLFFPKGAVWEIRFTNKALQKLKSMKKKITNILDDIFALQMGYISGAEILEQGPILYFTSFLKMIKENQSLVFAIVPERVPIVVNHGDSSVLARFQYRQYIRVIDIVQTNNAKCKLSFLENFIYHIKEDPDKWDPFRPSTFIRDNPQTCNLNQKWEVFDLRNIVEFNQTPSGLVYKPLLSGSCRLSPKQQKSYQFVSRRWVSSYQNSKFSYAIAPTHKLQNKSTIQRCITKDSCEWLLKFLQKIPNFNLKLTAQEGELISTPGNILCLGRSGTGKTTSAVLRLFALEILFKVRSNLFSADNSLKDTKLSSEDAESFCGLHSVIVTASPVLTNEIRRFYSSMKTNVIDQLKKKEQRRKEKQEQDPKDLEGTEIKLKQADEGQRIPVEKAKFSDDQHEEEEMDDQMADVEEMEENQNIPNSIYEMRNEDFPAFLTIKRLVYMVDASLAKPFFARNINGQIIGLDSQAQWHNEQKGVMMINNYYKSPPIDKERNQGNLDELLDYISSSDGEEEAGVKEQDQYEMHAQRSAKRRARPTEGESIVQEFAQEVDFEVFQRKFWPKQSYIHKGLTASQVWTEIFSVIKGSHNSASFALKMISLEQYLNPQSQRNNNLSRAEREKIYQICEKYEKWKDQIKGFDFMDLVNHVHRQMTSCYYFGAPIHFMLVDEVQDLNASTIKLLMQITEQNLYFAGDTAQTIAKGVGFRFCDLKQMLNMTDFEAPKVLQLSVNFRSHNQILALANSVITILELFFPSTIDKLHKERSHITGLKPVVLDSNLLDSLFYIFLGKKNSKDCQPSAERNGRDTTEFGCDQVVIVRDQEAKKRVPSLLQHALCLTVYEAKGLEFEDVVLFNFFTDSQVKDQWKLLNDIQVQLPNESKSTVKHGMQDLNELDFEADQIGQNNSFQAGEYEFSNSFYLSKTRENLEKECGSFCTELKQLYVCITRPKKRLIIYDEEPQTRTAIMQYWSKLDAVDVITEEMVRESKKSKKTLNQQQEALFQQLFESQSMQPINTDQFRKGWRQQGIKMFKRLFFEQAIKCFEHSGDIELSQRACAYDCAEKAARLMSESESLGYKLTDFSQGMTKQEKRLVKEEIILTKGQASELFSKAAEIFIRLGLKKQAAQCYYSTEDYSKAAQLFEEIGLYAQAGEAYYMIGDLSRAASLYSEGKVATKAIECYKKLHNYDAILNCIMTNEQDFTQEQREKLIYKYVPLALKRLYSTVTNDRLDGDEESDQEESYHSPTNRDDAVDDQAIQEEDSEDENDISDKTLQKTATKVEQESSLSSSILINDHFEVKQKELLSGSPQAMNCLLTTKQKEESQTSQSFSLISKSEIRSLENDIVGDSFEHLSQFHPDDEFLMSRASSIMESIYSVDSKSQKSNSQLSDYSIIDSSQEAKENTKDNALRNVNIIQTNRDIYAEDILMTKVIHLISHFSSDVKNYLKKLRSKDALLSVQQEQRENVPSQSEQIDTRQNQGQHLFDIDMDQLDEYFLNTLLDCLESFQLYKLCLIVCNRYQLTKRIGRYVVSIAYKYSNLPLIRFKYLTMFHRQHREMQHSVCFVAHQALHDALELIEPKYLKIKVEQMDQYSSLGKYCYTALLNLGYWKKLIYLVDVQSSLSIASMFSDFFSHRQVYLFFYSKQLDSLSHEEKEHAVESSNFDFLCELKYPTNQTELLAFRTALDAVVCHYADDYTTEVNFKFPRCFRLTEMAIETLKSQSESAIEQTVKELNLQMRQCINTQKLSNLSEQDNQCYVYDTCVAAMLLMRNAFKDNPQAHTNIFTQMKNQSFLMLVEVLGLVMELLEPKQDAVKCNLYHSTIIQGLLSVLKIRQIYPCPAIYDNSGDKVLVHSSSPLANELTRDFENKRQVLIENVTNEVLAQHSNGCTKQEINSRIRERQSKALNDELLDSMVEIIDLDANFLKVPLQLVIDKVAKKLKHYIEASTVSVIKSMGVTFETQADMDNLQTPFKLETVLQQLAFTFLHSQKVSKIVKREQGVKRFYLSSYQGQEEPHQQISQKRHIKGKVDLKQTQSEEFLAQAGLLPESYLGRQKNKEAKQRKKKDYLQYMEKQCYENISTLALLNFQPLAASTSIKGDLVQMAQEYWYLYIQSRDDSMGDLQLAMMSLGLYVMTDSYLYFLEALQKSLPAKSIDRQLLLMLLDAHFFKQCGDLQCASKSLTDFVAALDANEVPLNLTQRIQVLEMALVYALSAKSTPSFYLPFEQTKYLSHFFCDVDPIAKSEFLDSLDKLNQGEAVPLNLFLSNKHVALANTAQEKSQYEGVVAEILKLVCKSVFWDNQTFNQTHLYLLCMTILVNEGQIAQDNYDLVLETLDTLVESRAISEDSMVLQYDSFCSFEEDFAELDSSSQNAMLYLAQREEEQSVFVLIQVSSTEGATHLRNMVDAKLKQAEEIETINLQKHQRVADLMKPLVQRVITRNKQKALSRHVGKQFRQAFKSKQLLQLDNLGVSNFRSGKVLTQVMEVYNQALDVNKYICAVTVNSTMQSVIDLHYLLSQKHVIQEEILPCLNELLADLKGISSLSPSQSSNISHLVCRLTSIRHQVDLWTKEQQNPSRSTVQKNEKIMKLKWKEHALKAKKKYLSKVSGKKKEQALIQKKERLNGANK